ncbi:MAG TPA: hypothetical protein VGI90_05055 [Steroidobacteraceae bacterium]|jgi:hypothetical protein
MNRKTTSRRIASVLMNWSARLLPPARTGWAKAMRAEFDHIDEDARAMSWAVGCLLTGVKQRMISMIHGDLKISRWLLAPEMLLCFAPLSLFWLDGIDGTSGLLRLNSAVIHKYFIGVPGGTAFLIAMYASVLLATIGPIALVAAFRMIVLRRPIANPGLRVALIAAPILYGLMSITLRAIESGVTTLDLASADAFDFWSGIFLLAVLPVLGAAHLLKLSAMPSAERIAA